jgi:hypothetical protein
VAEPEKRDVAGVGIGVDAAVVDPHEVRMVEDRGEGDPTSILLE